MRNTIICAAFTAAALALTPGLAAAETQQRTTTAVVYRDLDLSTQNGRVELNLRIDRAARQVCGTEEASTGTRVPSRDARRCYVQAKRELDQQFAGIIRETQNGG